MKNKDLKSNVMTEYEVKTRTAWATFQSTPSEITSYHVYQDDGNDRIYCHFYEDYSNMIEAHPELS